MLLFPPYFCQICQGLFNLVYCFQRTNYFFIDYLYGLLFSLYFINFSPSCYYFSPSAFVFACSCFSRSLRCSIRSFIWDLSILLIYALMAINSP
jgi:hypothetical protein